MKYDSAHIYGCPFPVVDRRIPGGNGQRCGGWRRQPTTWSGGEPSKLQDRTKYHPR